MERNVIRNTAIVLSVLTATAIGYGEKNFNKRVVVDDSSSIMETSHEDSKVSIVKDNIASESIVNETQSQETKTPEPIPQPVIKPTKPKPIKITNAPKNTINNPNKTVSNAQKPNTQPQSTNPEPSSTPTLTVPTDNKAPVNDPNTTGNTITDTTVNNSPAETTQPPETTPVIGYSVNDAEILENENNGE